MKIGIVIDAFNVGGVEKIAIERVKALRILGEDACLVVLREPNKIPKVFKDITKGVPIVFLDARLPKVFKLSFRFPGFHFFSLFHLTYSITLPFVVRRQEFDYLIGHGTYTCFSLLTLSKFKKIHYSAFIWDPVTYIIERVYAKKFLKPLLWFMKKAAILSDKIILHNMDIVLVGGDAHNQLIHELAPSKELRIIYPSVHPIKKPTKKQDFAVMITAWKKGKNPEYITEVAAAIPELKIKMVGKWIDPLYKKQFLKLLKRQRLTKQIEVIGEVTESQLSKYLSDALFVLQTNDDKGFGMPALEAAGHATTFIIPKDQGVCKLFKNNEHGYYTKEKDTKRIASIANVLLQNKNLAQKMGINSWEKVNKNYSWERHAKQLLVVAQEHC